MRSLRTSLVLAVIVPLAVAVTAAGFLVLREMEREAVERMEEDVQLVARAIRLPLGRALERDRTGSVINALQSAFRIGRVYGAYLYDEEGELVSAFGTEVTAEDPDRISELAEGEDRMGEYGRAGAEEVYSYFVPLTSTGGRPIGLLQVTRQRSDIDAYVDGLRLRVGGVLFAGLAVMAGLVLVGHHGAVGRHLDRLLESMSRVEEGDRAHRAAAEGPAEIARLGSALNRMLDSIARAESEVRDHREEQLRLERELRRTEKMAAVGRLGAGVAHELGTPLSTLDGRAQRLLRRSDLGEDVEDEIRAVRREASRMERIVRQLLDFGRGVHGGRSSLSVERLVRSVVSVHRSDAGERGVELSAAGPDPAPVISADAAGMERVLGNLVRNALDAANARVEVGWFGTGDARGRDHEVGFVVRDDGPGVDPEVLDRIFEPFVTTKPTGRGSGLGLAVVHGVVEEHGGRVEVGTSAWDGAEFRVILPATEAASEDGAVDGRSAASREASGEAPDHERTEV